MYLSRKFMKFEVPYLLTFSKNFKELNTEKLIDYEAKLFVYIVVL